MPQPLYFRHDHTFTIVQFTDIHWKDGGPADRLSRDLMEVVLEKEKPDFVMFTGDVIYSADVPDGASFCRDPLQAFRDAVSVVEQRAIPWGVVFGNHDTEKYITREELMEEVTKITYTVAEAGPWEIEGVGNYTLPILNSDNKPAAVLYCLDSGSYPNDPSIKGYNWIHQNQIQWYMQQSRELAESNQGVVLPALAFIHIPLPEYRTVWEQEVCYGNKFENVCCSQVQSGMFAAMLERQDVKGVFCGHDHVNDYWGELHGIGLYYGRASGYNTYGREGFERGARVIRMFEGQSKIESWIRLADGSVITEQPEHQPEGNQ
ncbi:3',5'-cyclic adenosine monophosphate phosphodiesterase CpdA [compost metagenome]